MKKFAIVLSGCGVYDGAEIHEALTAMLAVSRKGHSYQALAPDIPQHHVINHLTGEVMPEKRNVMVEAARIADADAAITQVADGADHIVDELLKLM